ncbi:MAG: FAD binding domain-containing protein [Rhodobiaceae bacterium]|nr:FAD binding domain-containing protein [Rhodobiaceae bacterium]
MSAYHRPTTLADALAVRAAGPVTVLSGGTDVYPARTVQTAWGDPAVPDILDISAIAGLRGIQKTDFGWEIGAATRWSDVIRADLPPLFAGLQAAAREVGGVQIQNRGTLAGNLVTASPAGDGIPCLLALDASVVLASRKGERVLPLADFQTGYRQTALRDDELVTAILIPRPRGAARGAFVKLGARRYLVISIVMASAVLETDDTGTITAARIAVGACSPVARRIPALEARLVGASLGADLAGLVEPGDLAGLAPIDDIRASGAYRADAAAVAVRDLLARFAAGGQRSAA